MKTSPGGVYLYLKVQPRASRDEIAEPSGDELTIKITTPTAQAAANKAVISLLAEALDCPRDLIQMVSGHKSYHKTFWLVGLSETGVQAKLRAE